MGTLRQFSQSQVFLGPQARAGLAAAVLASSMATTLPAEAVTPKFSVFGIGSPGAVSDAYNQNDADAVSPYSQFSNPKDAIYKDGDDSYKSINKKIVERGLARLTAIPALMKANSPQGVMQQLQSDEMARSIQYMSLPESSPAWGTQKE